MREGHSWAAVKLHVSEGSFELLRAAHSGFLTAWSCAWGLAQGFPALNCSQKLYKGHLSSNARSGPHTVLLSLKAVGILSSTFAELYPALSGCEERWNTGPVRLL